MVNRIIRLDNYVLNRLDDLVFKFCRLLEKHTNYVIVSGYLSIVFGNSRPTLDVDVLFDKFTKENLDVFLVDLKKNDFDYIDSKEELYEIIETKKEKLDIFDNNSNWYFDFKKAKDKYDKLSLENADLLLINNKYKLKIAPIELQIPYKLVKLGSDKDIKDAVYLYNYFKDELDIDKLKEYGKMLNCDLSKIGVKLWVLRSLQKKENYFLRN